MPPDADDVIYLVGLKFGTQQDPARTWAVNTLIPAYVAERYARSRLVALSTGNVYSMTPVASGGSVETRNDELTTRHQGSPSDARITDPTPLAAPGWPASAATSA